MPKISEQVLNAFYAKTLLWFYVSGVSGFFLGMKICDWTLFSSRRYELLR